MEIILNIKIGNKKIKITTKRVVLCLLAIGVIAFAAYVAIAQKLASDVSKVLSVDESQELVDSTLAQLPKTQAETAKFLTENMNVTVNDVSVGNEKNLVLDCTVLTYNLYDCISENLNKYLTEAYLFELERKESGKTGVTSTNIRKRISGMVTKDLQNAGAVEKDIKLNIYEISDGTFSLYLSDKVIDTLYGGYIEAMALVSDTKTIEYNGETVDIRGKEAYRKGVAECFILNNYDSKKPDTSIPAVKWLNSIANDFYRNFLEKDNGRPRYMYIVDGLFNTLKVTVLALLMGIVIGFVVAVIRVTNHNTGKLDFLAWICKIYLAVMRGMPLMIQLLIIYFVFLLPAGVNKITSAILCFGLNSGAYVSEIVRGGIMSIDKGQTEAGRSIGFNYIQTMVYIIFPQAFKAVLPSLANEFISLLKETSVAFYIGVADLTLGGLKIRSITYSSFLPLVAVGIIYLVLVLGLSKLVSLLERRLRKGDNR